MIKGFVVCLDERNQDGLRAREKITPPFGSRCIPSDFVVPPRHTSSMTRRLALPVGRLVHPKTVVFSARALRQGRLPLGGRARSTRGDATRARREMLRGLPGRGARGA